MIVQLLAVQLTLASATAPGVAYADVPPEVVRVLVYDWVEDAVPVAVESSVDRQGTRVVIRTQTAHRVVVLLERQDKTYLLDGPFVWPPGEVERALDRRWRRTVSVSAPADLAHASSPEWVSAGREPPSQWPRCVAARTGLWSCWGIGAEASGIIVCRVQDRLWWTITSGGSAAGLRSSAWGRLVLVDDETGEPGDVKVRFAHPVVPSALRPRSVRLDTAPVAVAQALPVGPGAAWLFGDDIPAGAWVEVKTSRAGPAFLGLRDLAAGPSSTAWTMKLEESRPLDGVAVGASGEQAGGAVVTLFRLIDVADLKPASGDGKERPRRVLVGETSADAGGAFHFDGVGDAEYEVLVWHPQLGRASIVLPRQPGLLTIRLASPGIVRGRVVAGGKPRGGVEVLSVPAPEAYRAAEDLVDLKGGDARTGTDGRFTVVAAAGGGGELRVGGGTLPVRRIPLPSVPQPLLELGDIELGSPLEITIVLDQDSPCGVRATGPIGQSGLQIVLAARTGSGLYRIVLPEPGLWAFGLICGREGIALIPPTTRITPAHAGKELRFSVR